MRLEETVDVDDVLMAQAGEDARLVDEPLFGPGQTLRIRRTLRHHRHPLYARGEVPRQQFLDRDVDVQERVLREIGDAEAALPEDAGNAEFGETMTRRK